MSYLYQNRCFDTVQQLHENVAADCPAVSSGASIQCVPSSTDIAITHTDLATLVSTTSSHIPPQIACDPSLTDLTTIIWDISLIWIAAFTVSVIAKQLLKK
ncbi:hypothetical protein [Nitrosomonas aestuarii]|uniref:hypothetical protein n=1 Tax=Nitrosomonas aestuarii TaxID=52441 RepID=UPI000B8A38B7|nr:hypothetical protein [Nitrosomonas aestuarii]